MNALIPFVIAIYLRLSSEDDDLKQLGKLESNSIANQELLCKGWSHHLIHMTAVHLCKMVRCS